MDDGQPGHLRSPYRYDHLLEVMQLDGDSDQSLSYTGSRSRHQHRVRNFPWAMFFDGVEVPPKSCRPLCIRLASVRPLVSIQRDGASPEGRFFGISFSRLSRIFSARTRESSICSGVTTLVPGPLSFPAAATFTQLCSVCSTRPSSRATAPMPCPEFTRFTADSLNSAVYSCFGIFFNFVSPSNSTGRYAPSP